MNLVLPICLILSFLISCNLNQNPTQKTVSDTSSKNSEEEVEPDPRKLRHELILSYNKPVIFERENKGRNQERIKVWGKYYCLFDSALVIPGKYVIEDTTHEFVTHNFAEDIVIIVNNDTILKKTITKTDFLNQLDDYLIKYAVIMEPTFEGYDSANDVFDFGFSISIPVTDVGVGRKLSLGRDGKITVSELQ